MRGWTLWVLSFGKPGYPKTLSQTNLIIFSTFTTRQTHTQHQLETARKITSVSLTNIVGLLDKYLRKRLPTFALSKYCSDTKPTSLFIHRCPDLKYPFVRLTPNVFFLESQHEKRNAGEKRHLGRRSFLIQTWGKFVNVKDFLDNVEVNYAAKVFLIGQTYSHKQRLGLAPV